MKFLILRFSSIGDIVLTTPVVRCLKKKFPDAEIHYATKRAFHTIVQHNPYISKIHLLDNSVLELVNQLKQEKFDYVIDLHNNQRTFLIKTLLGKTCLPVGRSFSFNKINLEKWVMVNFKINRLPHKHIVDRYLDACASLGVVNDGEGLDYFLAKEDAVDRNTFPIAFQKEYAAWVIGAKQNTKKFPSDKISNVLSKLQMPVMLLGAKEDFEEGEKIIQQAQRATEIFNACGKFSLNQSASLVQQAKLVVTNDTGLMHIAAAFKKPTVSIWGNTIPEFGMYPYYGAKEIANAKFEVKGLSCRPCSKLGYSTCPKGHFNCMNLHGEKLLAEKIQSMMR